MKKLVLGGVLRGTGVKTSTEESSLLPAESSSSSNIHINEDYLMMSLVPVPVVSSNFEARDIPSLRS
jgi:hypothetical protein